MEYSLLMNVDNISLPTACFYYGMLKAKGFFKYFRNCGFYLNIVHINCETYPARNKCFWKRSCMNLKVHFKWSRKNSCLKDFCGSFFFLKTRTEILIYCLL